MKVLSLFLIPILFVSCDLGIPPTNEDRIDIVSIDGVDAISALLTFKATGNPTVSVVVIDASGEQHTWQPRHLESANGITTGIIEFSPVGPSARSTMLIATWATHSTEIPLKRP